MANIPGELKYSKEHEWVKVDGGRAVIGITDYAQDSLGDIVFVELPNVGDTFEAGDTLGVVESVKAASDIYTPLSGKVVEINRELEDSPEVINEDPYEKGWMVVLELSDPSQVENLLSKEEYEQFLEENA
ncbi:MAG: glycine cleavage system protein GcvH [Desulfotomaculum sp.]|nr:glycine cleavage system protein GcvH [Desulfotomaculum sp.]